MFGRRALNRSSHPRMFLKKKNNTRLQMDQKQARPQLLFIPLVIAHEAYMSVAHLSPETRSGHRAPRYAKWFHLSSMFFLFPLISSWLTSNAQSICSAFLPPFIDLARNRWGPKKPATSPPSPSLPAGCHPSHHFFHNNPVLWNGK